MGDVENLEKHIEESEETFDIEAALESDEPFDLEKEIKAGQYTEDEAKEKATERGWNEGGVDKYGHKISAVEFLERTPFFKKIDLMKGDIDRANKRYEQMAQQNMKIAQKAVDEKKKLISDFKAEKEKLLSSDSLDEDEVKRVKQIDNEIDSIDLEDNTDEIAETYRVAKDQFKKDNDWYGSNRAMTALADKVGTEYAIEYEKEHGLLPPPEDVFEYTAKEVKKDFPDRKRTRVVTTDNRNVPNNQKIKKKTFADLPEGVRDAAKMIMASTGDTEEEYLAKYNFDN